MFTSLGGFNYIIYVVLELALAVFLSVRIFKMKPMTAKICYLLYTILTGLTLTGIFLVYTKSSICFVFLATAIVFGAFALVGKFTKIDMTKWSIYLFFALIAIIVLQFINMFIANHELNMILCVISVLIFCAYTAYDVQKVYRLAEQQTPENTSIYCAFSLFLDFINLFIDLLRLFGKSKN